MMPSREEAQDQKTHAKRRMPKGACCLGPCRLVASHLNECSRPANAATPKTPAAAAAAAAASPVKAPCALPTRPALEKSTEASVLTATGRASLEPGK